MKYFVLLIIVLLNNQRLVGQSFFLSCNSDGNLMITDFERCCSRVIKNIGVMSDIAVTPSSEIFVLDTMLKQIDIEGNIISSTYMFNAENNIISGVGLLALDNDYLLMDYLDSLYKVDRHTGLSTNLGYTGYFCAGDFSRIDNNYFMTTTDNELIKITLSSVDYNILSVDNIGVINSPYPVYGLFSSYNVNTLQSKLFCILDDSIFEIDVTNVHLRFVCKLEGTYSYGTSELGVSSVHTLKYNVITPNNDGVNDEIIFDQAGITKIQVINRWGNVVFETNEIPTLFNGKNNDGINLTEGIYYYIIHDEFCENAPNKTVYELTIIR